MSHSEQNDESWLDDVMRKDQRYIDDDGFTEQVLSRLPPPRSRGRSRWRTPILAISALLAAVIGLVALPGGELVSQSLWQLLSYRPEQSPLPIVPALVTLLVIAGGAAAALAHD